MRSIICTIVKNEHRFIREWIEHNLKIGFDKVYLFEDFGSKSHIPVISDYIENGKVVLESLDDSDFVRHEKKGTKIQHSLYENFYRKCKKEKLADWCGFFDVDEFLMFEEGWDLERLENTFSDTPGILLAWKVYGANGHLKRPEGNVVDNYTTCCEEGFILDGDTYKWTVKSLVNVKLCKGMETIHEFTDCVFTDFSKPSNKLCFEKAWLNHYYSKSWEDYLERIFSRGNLHNNFRSLDQFFKTNPDLKDKEEEMIMSQRYRHAAATMWISRKHKLISGGNQGRLSELRNKYIVNRRTE